jgi:hypothetical protein
MLDAGSGKNGVWSRKKSCLCKKCRSVSSEVFLSGGKNSVRDTISNKSFGKFTIN